MYVPELCPVLKKNYDVCLIRVWKSDFLNLFKIAARELYGLTSVRSLD